MPNKDKDQNIDQGKEQMSIFGPQEAADLDPGQGIDPGLIVTNQPKTLHITYNNKKVDLEIGEIFDSGKYDEFYGISFSISPDFINEYLTDFAKIKIIVGIQDESIQGRTNQMAKNLKKTVQAQVEDEALKLYNGLNLANKEALAQDKAQVKVSLAYAIHSKFYLLNNSVTGDNRIILGSANLSYAAFRDDFPSLKISSFMTIPTSILYTKPIWKMSSFLSSENISPKNFLKSMLKKSKRPRLRARKRMP